MTASLTLLCAVQTVALVATGLAWLRLRRDLDRQCRARAEVHRALADREAQARAVIAQAEDAQRRSAEVVELRTRARLVP